MARTRKTHDQAEIHDCTFAFRCPITWQGLEATLKPSIRYCNECKRAVHLCNTRAELADARKKGLCVAVPAGIVKKRTRADLDEGIVGMFDTGYIVDTKDDPDQS